MEELYGPITGFLIASIVTTLTQLVKEAWKLENKPALLVSLLIALIWFVPFHLLWSDEITAKAIYASIAYSFLGWLTAMGLYSGIKTAMGK